MAIQSSMIARKLILLAITSALRQLACSRGYTSKMLPTLFKIPLLITGRKWPPALLLILMWLVMTLSMSPSQPTFTKTLSSGIKWVPLMPLSSSRFTLVYMRKLTPQQATPRSCSLSPPNSLILSSTPASLLSLQEAIRNSCIFSMITLTVLVLFPTRVTPLWRRYAKITIFTEL